LTINCQKNSKFYKVIWFYLKKNEKLSEKSKLTKKEEEEEKKMKEE
jgi:hypothetical protein